MSDSLEICRLSQFEIPEISELLNRVWPVLYGDTGCPFFSENYLSWVYGGPNATEHFLVGCRLGGKLIGFKAYLFRNGMFGGEWVRCYIATHLAIDANADMATRFELARYLSSLHVLTDDDGDIASPKGTVCLAFFEDTKSLAHSAKRIHTDSGIKSASAPFQQAVVDRFTLRNLKIPQDIDLRRATAADNSVLYLLLCTQNLNGFSWLASVSVIDHHYHAAPNSQVWLAERGGEAVGFLAGYTLDWTRQGKQSRMFVVETMIAADDLVAISLLAKASTHAVENGLRGVVVENPTYLGLDDPAACGVILTPRRMRAVARSKNNIDGFLKSFSCDIK